MRWTMALAIVVVGCTDYELNSHEEPNPAVDEEGTVDPEGQHDSEDPPDGLGGVTGRVCAPNESMWVAAADVWVEFDDSRSSTSTDGDGYFTLHDIPAGIHTVMVEKGSFSTSFEVEIEVDKTIELAVEECLGGEVEIAVVSGAYDSIQVLLGHLSLDYDLYDGDWGDEHVALMRDPQKLAEYDIIFFNCGMSDSWLAYEGQIAQNMRDYVDNGGSIYASDWAYYLIEASFPNMLTFLGNDNVPGDAYKGEMGSVNATILDAGMASALGSTSAEIYYDLGIWATPEYAIDGVPLLRGSFNYMDGGFWGGTDTHTGPLAARLERGDGVVTYTTFHNEQQNTFDMDVLLYEIILTL